MIKRLSFVVYPHIFYFRIQIYLDLHFQIKNLAAPVTDTGDGSQRLHQLESRLPSSPVRSRPQLCAARQRICVHKIARPDAEGRWRM